MLYERDYHLGLTETEEQQYEEITGRKFWEKRVSGFGRVNNFMAYPKAARMCKSLFPNNYLDVAELRDVERLEHANEEFLSLLDNTECTERSILNFIREKEYYHIIGSIIWGLSINIGNHGAYLFPEFQLGSSYKADYLLLGKSSGGFEFIFVELESPYGNITLKDGQLGAEFRDGISQLEDWKRWLPANYSSFGEIMRKYKNSAFDLPEEFYVLDMSADFCNYSIEKMLGFDSIITADLYCKWENLLDELDVVHQMYLYSLSNSGMTVDIKCAFLVELAEPLVEIVKKHTNFYASLIPGARGTSLKNCLDALITKYGVDIFERELSNDYEKFLSALVNSRVRIMHIKREQKGVYFNGAESVLYALKMSLLYRRIMFEVLGIDEVNYRDNLKKCVSRLDKWNDTLDNFLIKLSK